ncbi:MULTISPECIES: DUF2267 domain-containing protein [Nostoc]|uniref:DUF2267 domain-containing protein n=1 Tax=Nostoc paludosum FACHB-159 TaxID=2692908 RepID=A0ABR8K690_9NOSO|nr:MULTISPECIES: DUF2267 domain-containing protein [Nostoc]MBD2678066.1 DUF2267 domain-containing protein [Nostoc sp. FACHB-857]MBD2734324.1 DUF2267 domain-containing protein [Nostoc paludosum FACHB-159]
MQHDEFIGQVQNRAHLSSRGDAELATRATLETLAERLAGDEPFNAAAQLPRGIAEYMRHEYAGTGERFSIDEFFERVSQRESVELPDAVYHARVVIEVLSQAISRGEINDIRSQLPSEFDPLFEAGSEGRMRINT